MKLSRVKKVISKDLFINHQEGLSIRLAGVIAKQCNIYNSDVFVSDGETEVSGKSIYELITLALPFGSKVNVKAVGDDASEAIHSLENIIS